MVQPITIKGKHITRCDEELKTRRTSKWPPNALEENDPDKEHKHEVRRQLLQVMDALIKYASNQL